MATGLHLLHNPLSRFPLLEPPPRERAQIMMMECWGFAQIQQMPLKDKNCASSESLFARLAD